MVMLFDIDIRKVKKYLKIETKKVDKELGRYIQNEINCGFLDGTKFVLKKINDRFTFEGTFDETFQETFDKKKTLSIIDHLNLMINQIDYSCNEKQFILGQEDTLKKIILKFENGDFDYVQFDIFSFLKKKKL